jgi:tripartite-type tricarboxylate transporter receptor subunit TctC
VSGHAQGFAVIAAVSLAVVSAGSSGATAQGALSFKGKTITMIVGSEPGGGTDAAGRLIAPYLRRYLPGEPHIVVQNMPGASGITALNSFVHRTAPDGLTVMMGSISTIDPVVFRNSSARYDPKAFRIAGGIGRGGSVIFVNRDAEARLYDKAAKPVVIGSVLAVPRPGTQPALWCIEYLGWNATWVPGYRGTNETMLALDRGEIDMTTTGNIFQIQERLANGQLKILYQTGAIVGGKVTPRQEFGDAPLFPDLMRDKIKDPTAQKAFAYWQALNTGDKWIGLAAGTADEIVEAYRDAFGKVALDPEFLEHGEKISDGFAPMSPHDVEIVVQTLSDTPTAAVDYTKSLMRKQGLRVQ